MYNSLLKLNDEKTKFIIFGTWQRLSQTDDIKITKGQDVISRSTSVRNFGFHMAQHLKNNVHINKLSNYLYQTVKT